MRIRQAFAGIGVAGMALALAACGGDVEEPVEEVAGDCPPGVTVTDGWLAMPAVAGNPAAAYFTLSNETDTMLNLRAAEMIGSESAMLHETTEYDFQTDMQELIALNIQGGETVEFEPGGTHVMIFGLSEDMEPGGESEVTLTFAGGDKCSFPVTFYPAGTDPREQSAEAEEG